MKRSKSLLIAISAWFLVSTLLGDSERITLSTKDGASYQDVRVIENSPDMVIAVGRSVGAVFIQKRQLTDESKRLVGYDEKAAESAIAAKEKAAKEQADQEVVSAEEARKATEAGLRKEIEDLKARLSEAEQAKSDTEKRLSAVVFAYLELVSTNRAGFRSGTQLETDGLNSYTSAEADRLAAEHQRNLQVAEQQRQLQAAQEKENFNRWLIDGVNEGRARREEERRQREAEEARKRMERDIRDLQWQQDQAKQKEWIRSQTLPKP